MNTALERSRQTLCKTGYYYCAALLIGFIPLKWPMDENNHLFCGHGEQMFTVILCPVGRKKKASSTQHKQPRWPGSVRTLAFGSYFIYHGSGSTSLPSVRLSSPAFPSAGETCSQRSIMWGLRSHTLLGLDPSPLKPITHLQVSVFPASSCEPLPLASFCLGLWLCCGGFGA